METVTRPDNSLARGPSRSPAATKGIRRSRSSDGLEDFSSGPVKASLQLLYRGRLFIFGVIFGIFLMQTYASVSPIKSGILMNSYDMQREALLRSKTEFLASSLDATKQRRIAHHDANNKIDSRDKDDPNVAQVQALRHPPEAPIQEVSEARELMNEMKSMLQVLKDSPILQKSFHLMSQDSPAEENHNSNRDKSKNPDASLEDIHDDQSSLMFIPDDEPPNNNSAIVDFERQPRVVIAVKIHGSSHMKQLIQSQCLLKVAYNRRTKYDVLVFTTEPIEEDDARILRDVVHPAHLRIVTDKMTLSDQLERMTPKQVDVLVNRCQNVTTKEDLRWWTRCCEEGSNQACMPLAYSWQSEFRALHLWKSEFLKPYRYMLWIDSDAFPTRIWQQDPVAFLIRNKLKILFDNMQGHTKGNGLQERINAAYDESLCALELSEGHLKPQIKAAGNCMHTDLKNIHGFFHVTDLDFYRSEKTMKWSKALIGDSKFSRMWDDQIHITIASAMGAANKSWEMGVNGVKLWVYHNMFYDGKERTKGGFQVWWKNYKKEFFPEAIEECHKWVRNGG